MKSAPPFAAVAEFARIQRIARTRVGILANSATLLAAVLLPLLFAAGVAAQDKKAAAKAEIAEENAAKQLRWLDSLPKGYTLARTNRQPIFVRVGTQSCTYCRLLEAEIARPDAQQELQRWTLVALDADKSPDAARLLAVGPVPALRLLTPAGKLVVSHDGAMSAAELVKWLKKHHDSVATGTPADELAETGPPTVIGVVRLVREFQQRDAVLREAAIRRLMPHPDVAAVQVVKAFQEGKLSARLASLELLKTWKAPVDGIDPWRPKTLSKTRLAKLRNWATSTDFKMLATQKSTVLTAKQLAGARIEITRMLAATETEAAAARERLSRFGKTLLPEVYARLKSVETDQARSRLTALRYRLVASPQLVLTWPNGLERLSSASAAVRERAAGELAERAASSDESLLLELFSDPRPLIREIALRSLQKVGGDRASSTLMRLLDDPEPNVRAAVLKLLAEKPSPAVADKVAAFATAEKDADLLVHAVRVLRQLKELKPARVLIKLLEHKSWRVRAEAAEGLGQLVFSRGWLPDDESKLGSFPPPFGGPVLTKVETEKTDNRKDDAKLAERKKLRTETLTALLKRLDDEDSFVVSRAMSALLAAGGSAFADAPEARDQLWTLFGRPNIDAAFAKSVQSALHEAYLGAFGHFRYQLSEAPLAQRTKVAKQLLPKAKAGPPRQRVAALSILVRFDKPKAVEIADGMLADAKQSEDVRLSVYQLLLQNLPQDRAERRAAASLSSPSAAIGNLSLRYLALGTEAVADDTYPYSLMSRFGGSGLDRLIYPEAPNGLHARQLDPLLNSPDPRIRAMAGYLHVLLDRPSGLEPLLTYWRSKGRDDPEIRKLVYRAIAKLDDPKYLPVLKTIYGQLRKPEAHGGMSDFYWTVRIMTGPEVLEFRKQIRREVGMDKL